jgi:hypothetical protein
MANDLALEELRREGYIPWAVDRRLGSFVTCDFFLCGDVFGHWPNLDRMDRIVNACGEDVPKHIDKYLNGYSVERLRKNKETGTSEIAIKQIPPNPYLKTLLLKYEFYLYSFVLRTFKKEDGKRSDRKVYECRKWKAILSPEGAVSFELEKGKS